MTITWKLANDQRLLIPELGVYKQLDEVSLHLPQGVYTTFRTFYERSRVLGLSEHLVRLQQSALGSGWQTEINAAVIRHSLRLVLSKWPDGECRIRITVDLTLEPGMVYLTIAGLSVPSPEIYKTGVRVQISESHRDTPELKTTQYIASTKNLKEKLGQNVYEWLIVERGVILEGITSNFFGVENGKLVSAGEGILHGITRRAILQLAESQDIQVELRPVCLSNLHELQEAFITSSSRGVVPVVKIEDQVIGNGLPGSVTQKLIQAYQHWISENAEIV